MLDKIKIVDNQVLIFILLIILLAVVAAALKKGALVIKIPIKCIIGGALIYIVNFFASKVSDFSIPLNPLTASIIGILELPGIVLVLMIKYLIYPV